jgi:hypothetical protein
VTHRRRVDRGDRIGSAQACAGYGNAQTVTGPGVNKAGDFLRSFRFRGGMLALIHRKEFPGGVLFAGSRCRIDSDHSLPQLTSAGRKLITQFSDVNNFAEKSSSAGAPGRRRMSRASASAHATSLRAKSTRRKKTSAKMRSSSQTRRRADVSAASATHRRHACGRRCRRRKKVFATAPASGVCAVQKSEMRKIPSPSASLRTPETTPAARWRPVAEDADADDGQCSSSSSSSE